MNKLYGDVPQKVRDLLVQLDQAISYWDSQLGNVPTPILSKAYTCLAHDYYHIGLEEEGEKLLLRAENLTPGFFKVNVPEECKNDAEFESLIGYLTTMLAGQLLATLVERK